MKDILSQGFAEMGIVPPDGAVERLCRYGELLLEQNKVMNLTAITEPGQVARLHFLDSAAVLAWGERRDGAARPTARERGCGRPHGAAPTVDRTEFEAVPADVDRDGAAGASPRPTDNWDEGHGRPHGAAPTEGGSWLAGKSLVDVGTGAGFPGVVLKILEPSLSLTLVDSLGKRMSWLEKVCEALSLDGVRCFHGRAEELALEAGFRDGFDVAVSRAVAAFPALCELCLPYVRPGGVFLAMKSVESGGEVESGQNAVKRLGGRLLEDWDYPVPGAGVTHRIVGVRKVSPTPKGLPRAWGKIKKSPL